VRQRQARDGVAATARALVAGRGPVPDASGHCPLRTLLHRNRSGLMMPEAWIVFQLYVHTVFVLRGIGKWI